MGKKNSSIPSYKISSKSCAHYPFHQIKMKGETQAPTTELVTLNNTLMSAWPTQTSNSDLVSQFSLNTATSTVSTPQTERQVPFKQLNSKTKEPTLQRIRNLAVPCAWCQPVEMDIDYREQITIATIGSEK